jgi:hypothetical protein
MSSSEPDLNFIVSSFDFGYMNTDAKEILLKLIYKT